MDASGRLNEINKVTLDAEVVCLDVGQVPEGRQRCKFLAVGLSDNSVKLFSLDPETCLQKIATKALPGLAESVCLTEMTGEQSL